MWRVARHARIFLLGALLLLSLSPSVEARKRADEVDEDNSEPGFSSAPSASTAKNSAESEDSEAQVTAVRRLPKEDIFLQAEKYRNERDLQSALPLYEEAAQAGNDEALLVLGQLYEVTLDGVEQNLTRSIQYYNESAKVLTHTKLGNSGAMSALGFLYATGRGVDQSIPHSLVYHTFAASGDDTDALRVLGNRYLYGLGVMKNCEAALIAYERAARAVIESIEYTGVTILERAVLIDEETQPETNEKAASEDDVIEFYRYHAETGDAAAQTFMGTMHLEGWRVHPVEANDELAHEYFRQASAVSPDALAHLGYMHLKGRHVEQDNKTAVEYFKLAAARGSIVGMLHLGFLYLRGHAVPQDVTQAHKYFKSAADAGSAEGLTQLGIMYLYGWAVKADPTKAYAFFQNAKKAGHLGATYQFARMHELGIGPVRRSCTTATALYKRVAEGSPYGSLLADAKTLFDNDEHEAALLQYERAALMGFEVGQSNAAYIYDRILAKDPERNSTEMIMKALSYYELAAEQRRSSAYLRIGDFHYYGFAGLKKVANELGSAHAAWNLGYMYQWGEGLTRDLHLAKRFYDTSAERSPDAVIPAFLARLGLYIHIACDWLTSERIATPITSPTSETSPASSNPSTPATSALSPTTAELLRPPRARIAGVQWDTFLISFCTGLLGLFLWLRFRRG